MTTTAKIPNGWIVSPRYDGIFFIGSLLVPVLLWVAFAQGLLTGIAVYGIFQICFNMPHNFQTWTMSVLDKEDRQKHGRRYLVAFMICLAVLGIPTVFSRDVVYPFVRTALIYWGYYHLVRQHHGFQRLYERKEGGSSPLESKFYARALDAICYLPLLVRFRDPKLMTIVLPKKGGSATSFWIHHPTMSTLVWHGICLVYGLIVFALVAHTAYLMFKPERRPLPRALLFLSVTLAFSLATMVVGNIIVGIALITSYHNLQYLGLMWFHNKNRADEGTTEGNRPLQWIATKKLPLYFFVTFIYGVVILLPRVLFPSFPLAGLPLAAIVAFHYYVDSRMWRFPKYPERGRWLRLGRPRKAPSAS